MERILSRFLYTAIPTALCVMLISAFSGLFASPHLNAAEAGIRISFEGCEIGKPPAGWVSINDRAQEIYSVFNGDSGKYLHADAQGLSVQIGLEKRWSLQELPIVEWRWRAVQFPTNSDERHKSTNDSVLGLYIIFGYPPFSYHGIKYIWSDNLPVGTSFDSPFSSKVKILVIESGRDQAGKWVVEKRNVLSDYGRLFNAWKAPDPTGIAVLTDADNTDSRAVGDYGVIAILPQNGTASP